MNTMIYSLLFIILSLISTVLWLVVLIRSFKKGGVLIGILGIFCGFITFIWGWIKHKEAKLTKVMLLWTILMVLTPVLFFMVGTAGILSEMKKQGIDIQSLQQGKSSKDKKSKNINRLRRRSAGTKQPGASVQKPGMQAPGTRDPNSMAVALWKDGKYVNPNRAIVYLNQAIKQTPNFAEAYNNRGNAYRDLKQHQKALQDYNQAIRIKPQYVKAFSNRGNVYYDLKKYQQAIKDYNQAIKLNPAYSQAYINRGLAYHKIRKKQQACKDFKKACELGDCDGNNWARQSGICK